MYLWPLKEMETGCSFPFSPSPLSNASVFPHLFFSYRYLFLSTAQILTPPPQLKQKWQKSWAKSHLKRVLVPDPSSPCACVERQRRVAVQTLPAHWCSSPHAAGTESPLSDSTTGNGLMGAQEHLPAVLNAMPALSFRLLSHFSVAGPGLWAWHREREHPWVRSSWCTPNWLSLQHAVIACLHCVHLPKWSVLPS